MHRIDGPGATGQSLFTEGNPATGTPATTVTADWLNAVQEELVELLAALGGSPDKQQNDQLATALMAALGELVDATEPATQEEAEAGTETDLRRWSPLRVAQAIAALAPPASPTHEIGEVFALWDHLDGVDPPDNAGAEKYIRLTAGQAGSGGYNEGLLTDESVSGSGPLVEATAEIATGPLEGEMVHLVNTEGALIRPGTTGGVLQMDQMQGHWHAASGNFPGELASPARLNISQRANEVWSDIGFADVRTAISDGDNGTPRVGDRTRDKAVSATYYMRIA